SIATSPMSLRLRSCAMPSCVCAMPREPRARMVQQDPAARGAARIWPVPGLEALPCNRAVIAPWPGLKTPSIELQPSSNGGIGWNVWSLHGRPQLGYTGALKKLPLHRYKRRHVDHFQQLTFAKGQQHGTSEA